VPAKPRAHPPRHASTVTATFTRAIAIAPSCRYRNVSKLKVEYVVKPPSTPAASVTRAVCDSVSVDDPTYIKKASSEDPTTFTASVP